MSFLEILLISVSLAADAFAVSICKGLSLKKINIKDAVKIGIWFGLFQALMPTIGFFLGETFEHIITSMDHWIAFILLAIIGGKMIAEVIKGVDNDEEESNQDKLDLKELTIMAVATSIDALAVGITFAFLSYPLAESVTIIGVTTFVISIAGVYIGNIFGSRYKKGASLIGGIILILIGLKILLEHLNILNI